MKELDNYLELEFAELFSEEPNAYQSVSAFEMEEPSLDEDEPNYGNTEYEEPEYVDFDEELIMVSAKINQPANKTDKLNFEKSDIQISSNEEHSKLNQKQDSKANISNESEAMFEQLKVPAYNKKDKVQENSKRTENTKNSKNINNNNKESNNTNKNLNQNENVKKETKLEDNKVVIENNIPNFKNTSSNVPNLPQDEEKIKKGIVDNPEAEKGQNKPNLEENKASQTPKEQEIEKKIDNTVSNSTENPDTKKEENNPYADNNIEFDMSFDEEYFKNIFREEDYYNVNYSTDSYGEYMSDDEYNKEHNYTNVDIDIIENIESTYADEKVQEVKSKKVRNKKLFGDIIPEKYKTATIFIIMMVIILGIPLISALVENGFRDKKKNTVKTEDYKVDSAIYEDAKEQYSQTQQNQEQSSGRFSNIDELTLYIESTSGTLLSNEMQAVNKYNAGSISKEEFLGLMDGYIEQANNLNHLLLINEPAYTEKGMTEEYNTMFENIKTLLVYGDTAVLNVTK